MGDSGGGPWTAVLVAIVVILVVILIVLAVRGRSTPTASGFVQGPGTCISKPKEPPHYGCQDLFSNDCSPGYVPIYTPPACDCYCAPKPP